MPRKILTQEQTLFVTLAAVPGTSATQAYKQAYPLAKYPGKEASRLMKNVGVSRALVNKRKLLLNKVQGTAERATEMIAGIAEIDYGDYTKERNSKGIELLAKSHGLLVDKTDNVHRLGESEMAMAARIAQEEREKDKTALEDAPEGPQKD